MPSARLFSSLLSAVALVLVAAEPMDKTAVGTFPQPTNSEKAPHAALSPADAISQLQLPEGFKATVFAAEPDIQQPIAFTFDARGRLWVAEGYTYADQALNYDLKLKDRILIFEDADNNGVYDTRKVFWEGAQRLTGLEIGFDGVYALTLPELIFLPDQNHDDKPDSAGVVLLDGFNHAQARHTMANGLVWGPDGWLYGRQGILGTSQVGPPGTSEARRTSLNVGIWRFHQQKGLVEMVTSGTTNPWGMDWNEFGEAFHINTVIGHLWHAIPGGHFRRMFGEDPNPNVFQVIEQHADHFHWDTKELWSDVRNLGVTPGSSKAGGGHAHTGLMIYLGDNWPREYRGDVFTINFHGRRLNRDHLEPQGTGFVAKHRPDFAQWGDPWFRGIDLKYGPDGGVYVADWSDTGECHDHDGVHRVSGRMYKITHGTPKKPTVADVQTLQQPDLMKLLKHPNEWYFRQARLELQRRAGKNQLDLEAVASLKADLLESEPNPVHQVRALLALHATGLDNDTFLVKMLGHANPHVRVWAIRFLTDPATRVQVQPNVVKALVELVRAEKVPAVRLAFASAMRHIPLDMRANLAKPLLAAAEDATDHNQPMMLWYAIEPLAGSNPIQLAELFKNCKIPLVRKWIVRRIVQSDRKLDTELAYLVKTAAEKPDALAMDLMSGISEGMSGRRRADKPKGWDAFAKAVESLDQPKASESLQNLNAFFGDGLALEAIRKIALDTSRDLNSRRQALAALIEARSPNLKDDCRALFQVRDLSATAASGLVHFDEPALADETINNFSRLYGYERAPVISALITKPGWALKILSAVEAGKVRREEITALMARQIRGHSSKELDTKLNQVWVSLRDTPKDRLESIAQWKQKMQPANLANRDLNRGRSIFQKTCASCHKMYGEGGTSGPELTGSGRDNLDYLLQNIIDPSGQVPAAYRLSTIAMKDGRLLSGVVVARTAATLGVQTATERVNLDTADVDQIKQSEQSLMPDGLLQNMTDDEVRDLFGFLMKK